MSIKNNTKRALLLGMILSFASSISPMADHNGQIVERENKDGINQRIEFLAKTITHLNQIVTAIEIHAEPILETSPEYQQHVNQLQSWSHQIAINNQRPINLSGNSNGNGGGADQKQALIGAYHVIIRRLDAHWRWCLSAKNNIQVLDQRLEQISKDMSKAGATINLDALYDAQEALMEQRTRSMQLFEAEIKNVNAYLPSYSNAQLAFDVSNASTLSPQSAFLKPLIRYQKDNIVQLGVKYQMDVDGGGSASCGYHALKNGIVIARLLTCAPGQRLAIMQELTSSELVQKLFGSASSQWRQQVILDRKRKLFLNFIKDVLLLSVKGCQVRNQRLDNAQYYSYTLRTNQSAVYPVFVQPDQANGIHESIDNDDERKVLCGRAPQVANELLAHLALSVDQQDPLVIDGNTIRNTYKAILLRRDPQFHALATDAKINQYLPNLAQVRIIIGNDIIEEEQTRQSMSGLRSYLANPSAHDGGVLGDWLTSDEMVPLITFEQHASTLLANLGNITIIKLGDDNHGPLAASLFAQYAGLHDERLTPEELRNVKENYKQASDAFYNTEVLRQLPAAQIADYYFNGDLVELALRVRDPHARFVAVVILRYPGHWITCVVDKQQGAGNVRYILADSINSNYTGDSRIRELINILEGHYVPESTGGCTIV